MSDIPRFDDNLLVNRKNKNLLKMKHCKAKTAE